MPQTALVAWTLASGSRAANPIPFAVAVEQAAALGFAGIELGGFGDHPSPITYPTPDDRERLKGLAERHGLALTVYAPDLGAAHLLDAREPDGYVAAFAAACAFATSLGIDRLRIDTVQPAAIHREADYPDLLRRLVDTWDRCVGMAGDQGVRVLWEPSADRAFNRPADVQRVLERLQHEHFGVLFDTWQAHLLATSAAHHQGKPDLLPGGALELIRRLSGRIGHVHVADGDRDGAPKVLGDGTLDLEAIVAALVREDGGRDHWGLEPGDGPDLAEDLARGKQRLDDLLKRHERPPPATRA